MPVQLYSLPPPTVGRYVSTYSALQSLHAFATAHRDLIQQVLCKTCYSNYVSMFGSKLPRGSHGDGQTLAINAKSLPPHNT